MWHSNFRYPFIYPTPIKPLISASVPCKPQINLVSNFYSLPQLHPLSTLARFPWWSVKCFPPSNDIHLTPGSCLVNLYTEASRGAVCHSHLTDDMWFPIWDLAVFPNHHAPWNDTQQLLPAASLCLCSGNSPCGWIFGTANKLGVFCLLHAVVYHSYYLFLLSSFSSLFLYNHSTSCSSNKMKGNVLQNYCSK